MIDIANALDRAGIDVSLMTGRLVVRNTPVAESVKVIKIAKYVRRNNFLRLATWLIAFLQLAFIIKFRHRKDYLFLVTNPPLVAFLPLICKNRYSFMVFDIYPETLTRMGVIDENSAFIRFWKRTNKIVLERADTVFTLTERMATQLSDYCSNTNVKITPIWSDNKFFRPINKNSNPFFSHHELSGHFIVLYSGNLGNTHNVEIIPELASHVSNRRILFLIIGDGDRKKWLLDEIEKRQLTNCKLLPLQPVEDIPFSFASGDIALVAQGTQSSGLSMPSKTFDFMSAGLPLLCIAGKESELYNLVDKFSNGKCFTAAQVHEIVTFLEELAEDEELCESYRNHSLLASRSFTRQNAEGIAEIVCGYVNPKP